MGIGLLLPEEQRERGETCPEREGNKEGGRGIEATLSL